MFHLPKRVPKPIIKIEPTDADEAFTWFTGTLHDPAPRPPISPEPRPATLLLPKVDVI